MAERTNPLDHVPQARPLVNSHDHLWAQLETLNADATEAQRVRQDRGFFGSQHADALLELRRLQIDLAKAMTNEEKSSGLQHYQGLWSVTDPDALKARLFHDSHFELLNESVAQTSAKLDEIAALIDASDLSGGRPGDSTNDASPYIWPAGTPTIGSGPGTPNESESEYESVNEQHEPDYDDEDASIHLKPPVKTTLLDKSHPGEHKEEAHAGEHEKSDP